MASTLAADLGNTSLLPSLLAGATLHVLGFQAMLSQAEVGDNAHGIGDDVLKRVDAVMVLSVDGRVHLAQAKQVIAARKPVFVDKPFTASVKDAIELARKAKTQEATDITSQADRNMKLSSATTTIASPARNSG